MSSDPAENTAEPFARRVFSAISDAGAIVGAGGYDEARLIYAAPRSRAATVLDERRTVHIGLDLTMPAGSPLYAPFDGVVHGFEDAAARLDYGPVIVLRHEIAGDEPLTFYTLYGHLSRQSLAGLHVGQAVKAGEPFAAIGPAPENGDWWPHVHVQIITDLLDVPCNFNGVAPASQRRTWLSSVPDPNLMLGHPVRALCPAPSRRRRCSTRRRQHFGGNVRLSYASSAAADRRAAGCSICSTRRGATYIDAYNNVPHVGHAHPRGDARRGRAAGHAQHQHPLPARAWPCSTPTALVGHVPAVRSRCATSPPRAARPTSWRCAWRAPTPAPRDLVVMDAAYHGHTTTLIDISPYKHAGPGGAGAPDWVHTSPIPDVYRGAHRARRPTRRREVRARRRRGDRRIRARGRGLCGYIAETCPSVGGQIVMPAGFLSGGLPPRARGRRRVHRGRGADRLRAHGHPLLGVRRPWRGAGHRGARQAHRERLSDGRGHHDACHRRQLRQRDGVLQHLRRQHRGLRRRAGHLARDRRTRACRRTR